MNTIFLHLIKKEGWGYWPLDKVDSKLYPLWTFLEEFDYFGNDILSELDKGLNICGERSCIRKTGNSVCISENKAFFKEDSLNNNVVIDLNNFKEFIQSWKELTNSEAESITIEYEDKNVSIS